MDAQVPAEEAHLSRSQLARSFDATPGTSPMAYLRQIRLRHMTRLLESTDLSIGEAAQLVGWTDANYASRCFHACYGMSPTEFRRRQVTLPIAGQRSRDSLGPGAADIVLSDHRAARTDQPVLKDS
ncbi:MAG: helix-turn-helix transcriptional regulator [Solirubrobacteraceae bacterium]